MRFVMKPDKQTREEERDHGFRIYKVRHSTRRVLFEIALIAFGFVAIISLTKALVSHIR